MKISIVTVCFNSAKTIRKTIESVLAQTYPDIEHIIIDGGSRDDTLLILKEYQSRISKIVSEADNGIYDAMNKGIALATGNVIGILNSDDFYESPSVLEDIAKCFAANDQIEMVYGDIVFVSPSDLHKVTRHFSSKFFRPWMLRFGWMPPHTGSFIKKAVFDRLGLYKLNYETAADYEMFVRLLLLNNIKCKRIDKVLVRMQTGGATTSGLKSNLRTSYEIVKSLRENKIYSNLLLVLLRLPIKFFLETFFKSSKTIKELCSEKNGQADRL